MKEGNIYIYNFHDFSNPIEFNLLEEVKKGQKQYYLSNLFQERNEDYTIFIKEGPTEMIERGYKSNKNLALMFYNILKANYPKEWMAALMTCDHDDLTKVSKFIRECQALDIKILPPDVNKAGLEFSAIDEGIYFALSAVKGVGESCVEAIVEEREANGQYQSLYDFICRIEKKRVTKRNIENLIDAGCFNFENWSKDAMRLSLDQMYEHASRSQKEKERGIMNLFSLIDGHEDEQFSTPPKVTTPSSELSILQKEKQLLGFYLSGHPLESFKEIIASLECSPLSDIDQNFKERAFRIAFILEDVQVKISQRTQKKFAILLIGGGFELPIWPELFQDKGHLLVENNLLAGVLLVDKKEGLCLNCHHLEDLTNLDDTKAKEFQEAYQRLATRVERGDFKKKKSKGPEKKMEKKLLSMTIDTKKLKLSHILKLKKIIRQFSGDHELELFFSEEKRKLGLLKIDSKMPLI